MALSASKDKYSEWLVSLDETFGDDSIGSGKEEVTQNDEFISLERFDDGDTSYKVLDNPVSNEVFVTKAQKKVVEEPTNKRVRQLVEKKSKAGRFTKKLSVEVYDPKQGFGTADIERELSALSVSQLLCLVKEVKALKDGMEKVFITPSSKPEKVVLTKDATSGQCFFYRKLMPHQHKAEIYASARCHACLARTIQTKATIVLSKRKQGKEEESEEDYMTTENIRVVRDLIVLILDIPPSRSTNFFNYE